MCMPYALLSNVRSPPSCGRCKMWVADVPSDSDCTALNVCDSMCTVERNMQTSRSSVSVPYPRWISSSIISSREYIRASVNQGNPKTSEAECREVEAESRAYGKRWKYILNEKSIRKSIEIWWTKWTSKKSSSDPTINNGLTFNLPNVLRPRHNHLAILSQQFPMHARAMEGELCDKKHWKIDWQSSYGRRQESSLHARNVTHKQPEQTIYLFSPSADRLYVIICGAGKRET